MSRSLSSRTVPLLLAFAAGDLALGSCRTQQVPPVSRSVPTAASVRLLHAGVTIGSPRGPQPLELLSRVDTEGSVRTDAPGRAILQTDTGIELRMAGDTEVRFTDSRPRLVQGQLFATSWGEQDEHSHEAPRIVELEGGLTLTLGDTAAEIERTAQGAVRVITVRGELAWRTASHQGRLAQGEALEGTGENLRAVPAAVWDDWTGGAASPQGAAPRRAQGAAEASLHVSAGDAPAQLTVNEHHVTVQIDGDLALTTVSQRFFNGSDATAPVEYRVRMPQGALVQSFGVERYGALTPARPAPVASINAQGGGVSALVGTPEGGLFARLDPLASGQSVRVQLVYAEWLPRQGRRRSYVYPMGDPANPPYVGEFQLDFQTDPATTAELQGPAGAQRINPHHLRITQGDFRPRADLQLDLVDANPLGTPSARLWRSRGAGPDGAHHVLADVNLPPPDARGTDLVIVLDSSAASETGTLTTATAAIDGVLHLLGPNDRVALLFGDLRGRPATGVAGELGPATPQRREALLDAVGRAQGAGATDLRRILGDAYARLDPSRNGAVLYLGDAMPTMGPLDPGHLFDETLRIAPDLRLYVVALGNDAHPETLERLTRRGGLLERASDQAEAVTAAQRLAAHALRPVLRDVTVDLGPTVHHPLPVRIENYVYGDPLQLVGELDGRPPERITVRARVGGQVREWPVDVRSRDVFDQGDLRRRWGRMRMQSLEDQGVSAGSLADLGVRFGLVTTNSALVLGAPGAVTTSGFDVAGSAWREPGLRYRLPRLGVGSVLPRGVPSAFDDDEYPIYTDEGFAWTRHTADEGASAESPLASALALAEPQARACVERARQARPQLQGGLSVTAQVLADGHLGNVTLVNDYLGDTGASACIRRVVSSLVVPAPSLFGETAPRSVSRSFNFTFGWTPPRTRNCPPSSRLPRSTRMLLWRERVESHLTDLQSVWTTGETRCELRLWEDRTALLDMLVRRVENAAGLGPLRNLLPEDAQAYLDRAVARRWGPSQLFRAYLAQGGFLNWGTLIRVLEDPAAPMERKLALGRAYLQLAPRDFDLRLRMLALYEQAQQLREARRIAVDLRRDPASDARVRQYVGEFYLRNDERDEGLRAFTEIAEWSPYDTGARERLGDLLLTYGGDDWAAEAYEQYRTLLALRPDDNTARVRLALAAARAGRQDEALRLLRSIAEDAGTDQNTPVVEALLYTQISRLAAAHATDAAVAPWVRIARLLGVAREGAVLVQWSHPDLRLTVRAKQPGDTEFVTVTEGAQNLPASLFVPGTALDGSRLILRVAGGLGGRRTITARALLLRTQDGTPRLVERELRFDAAHRQVVLVARNGQLADDTDPLPPVEAAPTDAQPY